jgi:hypothetical protein
MVAHGNHFPIAVEYGAGIVAALFNVWRERGAPQGCAHLLGNRVVKIFEDFEFDGITLHHAQFKGTWNRGLVLGIIFDSQSRAEEQKRFMPEKYCGK